MPTLVEIVPYDPEWPSHFSGAEAALRMTLGSIVLAIDHIGSTAIPRMSAKPIIDIDVTLLSLSAIPAASASLIEAGYEPRGNRYDADVWAFMLQSIAPKLRVYLCPPNNLSHERRMVFRDYLRHHEDAAEVYSALKKRLAEQFPYNGDRYTSEKSEFVQEVLGKS